VQSTHLVLGRFVGRSIVYKVSKRYTHLRGGISSGPLIDYQLLKDSDPCRYAFNFRVSPDPHECRLVNPLPNGSHVFNHFHFINKILQFLPQLHNY
jgi:hypothetical protein